MKQYLPGVVIACCMMGFSYCTGEQIETADRSVTSVVDTYTGWFLGVGLSHQHTKGEVLLSDNLLRDAKNGFSLIKTSVGRLGGSVVGGYGTFLDDTVYVGGEFTVDVTGSKQNENTVGMYMQMRLKTKGFIPTLAVRLGFYIPKIDSLFYIRGGVSFLNNKFEAAAFNESIASQRVTPVAGIGIEKRIYDAYSLRLEGDYRFSTEKSKNRLPLYEIHAGMMPGYSGSIKNKTHGYAIRLMCVYHF